MNEPEPSRIIVPVGPPAPKPPEAAVMLSRDGRTAYRIGPDGTWRRLPENEAARFHLRARAAESGLEIA